MALLLRADISDGRAAALLGVHPRTYATRRYKGMGMGATRLGEAPTPSTTAIIPIAPAGRGGPGSRTIRKPSVWASSITGRQASCCQPRSGDSGRATEERHVASVLHGVT